MESLIKTVNPLDKFATYSVHYIMLACRTTQEAKAYSTKTVNPNALAAINKVEMLGDAVPYGTKDTAFLVMDTRRFSQFSVESMQYETLINGLSSGDSHANLSTEIKMTVVDASGISFINFLQWLMDEKMQTNFDGIIFMIQVLFVGHTADGKTETVQTISIPAHLFKIGVGLDHARGIYNIEFMPNSNFNTTKHDRWLHIYNATSYFTGNGSNTLGSIVNSFEEQLNKASLTYYNSASNKVQQVLKQSGGSNNVGKFGRLVRYMITIPEEWENFEFTGTATNSATEKDFRVALAEAENSKAKDKPENKDAGGTPTSSHFSVNNGIQITSVLDLMFKQVKQIADLGNGRKSVGEGGVVTFYKHIVGITSDDESMIVHVNVVPFVIPNIVLKEKNSSALENDYYHVDSKTNVRTPKNYLEYNYIFTGKNSDILNFDMQIQDLQWMLASNLNLGAGALTGVTEYGQSNEKEVNEKKKSELISMRPFDPFILPKNTEAELKNYSDYAASLLEKEGGKDMIAGRQDYIRNLSLFYAASPITTMITIRGNPLIMQKFCIEDFAPHQAGTTNTGQGTGSGQVSNVNTTVKKEYRKLFLDSLVNDNPRGELRLENGSIVANTLGNGSYTGTPIFVKININQPNVDFRTGIQNGGAYASTILQDNYYVVMKVSNKIEGGNFTQDLELYSHNVFGNGKYIAPDQKAKSI
jgi:hypothetical protein